MLVSIGVLILLYSNETSERLGISHLFNLMFISVVTLHHKGFSQGGYIIETYYQKNTKKNTGTQIYERNKQET